MSQTALLAQPSQPTLADSLPLMLAQGITESEAQAQAGTGESVDERVYRGAALKLQNYTSGEVIISGPSETGKTVAALNLVDIVSKKYSKARGAIVRKVRSDMASTVLEIYKREFVEKSNGNIRPFGGENVEFYEYLNSGTKIYIGGMDRPGKVLSGALDFAYANQAEELDVADWETLTTRTTGRAGVMKPGLLIGDCNPGPPSHWILHRPQIDLLHSRHEDNPSLFDDNGDITEQGKRSIAILDALTGVRKKRLRSGLWVAAEGTVYDFDPAVHEIDAFPIPQDWPRVIGIDFGYTNPFVCQWWAFDGDGRMYLYREIYMTGRTVKAHAKKIIEMTGSEPIYAVVADHDAEDRATLEENGIFTIPAEKEITPGIEKVQERIKIAGDKKPRLFIMRGALVERDESLVERHLPTCTREECDVFCYPKDSNGKTVKEIPIKLNDHGMDTMRYVVKFIESPLQGEKVVYSPIRIGNY